MKKWIIIFPIMATLAAGSAFAKESVSSGNRNNWKQCPSGLGGDYGSWYFTGKDSTKSQPLPFDKVGEVSNIELTEGIFTLPSKGIYMITFGIRTAGKNDSYELQYCEDGQDFHSLPGGKFTAVNATEGMSSLTTMFHFSQPATQIRLQNISKSSSSFPGAVEKTTLGPSDENTNAYISILQISH